MPIHPTAVVSDSTALPADVEIGPYAIVEKGVSIRDGVRIGAFCHLYSGVELGAGVTLEDGVMLGNAPQTLRISGASTRTIIGSGSRLREYVTVNRASESNGETRIGRDCLIMAYTHIAHDCHIGDRAVIANGVQLSGHVRVGQSAVISGLTGVHQFVSIGSGAFIGGGLRVDQDVPPYCRALGDPLRWGGLNLVGLRRGDADGDALQFLDGFYRRVFREGEASALDWMRKAEGVEEFKDCLEAYFRQHQRGLLRRGPAPLQ